MARRHLLLHHHLLALAATASLLLLLSAASPVQYTTATPPPSSDDAAPVFLRGARRLGPPYHLRRHLSELPATATSAYSAGAPAPAAAAAALATFHDNGKADGDMLVFFLVLVATPFIALVGFALLCLVFLILRDCALLLASLLMDLYAAAAPAPAEVT